MEIIEFRTTVKDGVIEIPPEYQGKVNDRIRVILIPERRKSRKTNLILQLLNKPLQEKGFRPLSRDEIYGR